MNSIYVCFNFNSVSLYSDTPEEYDRIYQNVYKPLARFLYSHPGFKFSFSLTGPQLVYYKKKRNEFISILKQLVERNQVEIIGGGFHSPVLPLLFPVDRNTQIDMLSTEIRQTIGKRPRGISMFGDIWDSSLVNNLQTCGIEYAILDNNSIPENKRKFLYYIMNDLGKSVQLFPFYNDLLPEPDLSADLFLRNIIKTVEKNERQNEYFQINPDKIIVLNLNYEQIKKLMDIKWFEQLDSFLALDESSRIKTGIIDEYRKNQPITIPAYIPVALNKTISEWTNYSLSNRTKNSFPCNVFDFMDNYELSKNLYNRITYMTILINQYKNDKMRKKAAREKLLEAQNGNALLCTLEGPFTNTKLRQDAYRCLITADKFLREDSKFNDSVIRYDYTNDGINEYVCRMQSYFAYINLLGGAVQELDVMKNCGNYADNLSRIFEYDGVEDGYKRGLLIDHIFDNDQYTRYINGVGAGDGVFSRIYYKEVKFSPSRYELILSAEAEYKPTHQNISLKKKYIFNPNGMTVQYIIKNESSKNMKLKFAVESNFADVSYENKDIHYFDIEASDGQQVYSLEQKKASSLMNNSENLKKTQAIRLTDSVKGVAFAFEPNETCEYYYSPLLFRRPDFHTNQLVLSSVAFVSTLIWDIDIESGKETEKTINFSITSVKKEKK